jgi:hypothetical protein
MFGESARISEEVAVDFFKVGLLCWYCSKRTGEINKIPAVRVREGAGI